MRALAFPVTLRPLIFWISCAGALAAGWFAGVSGSGTPRSTASGAAAPSQPPPLIHAGGHGLALNPGSAAGQWVARVRRATDAEFASLWREIEHVWPDDRTTIHLYTARLAARKILLASWMSQDWMAVCAFVAQETDPDQLEAVASGVAEILVALHPSVAAEILRGSRDLALSAHPAFRDTLWRKLAAADPQGFLALMPGDPADRKTWSSHFLPAMATWAKSDPVAVAAYWEAQAGSLFQSSTSNADQAILGLAGGLLSSDIEAAWIWALAIRPGSARTSGLSMVTQRWTLDDPEAARAAVEQSPLSAAEKEEIQRPGNLRKFESGGRAHYFNMSPKAP